MVTVASICSRGSVPSATLAASSALSSGQAGHEPQDRRPNAQATGGVKPVRLIAGDSLFIRPSRKEHGRVVGRPIAGRYRRAQEWRKNLPASLFFSGFFVGPRGFRDRRLQPLGHLSGVYRVIIADLGGHGWTGVNRLAVHCAVHLSGGRPRR